MDSSQEFSEISSSVLATRMDSPRIMTASSSSSSESDTQQFRSQPIPTTMRTSNVLREQLIFPGTSMADQVNIQEPGVPQATAERLVIKSNMPMPSSEMAPRFEGEDLQEFLADYEIGTSEAGWTDYQRCRLLPYYCKRSVRSTVRSLPGYKTARNWDLLKRQLIEAYPDDSYNPRYRRKDVERFVRRPRIIRKRAHFAEYYRKFMTMLEYVKPKPLSREDSNLLFWEGLPSQLQKDLYDDLRIENPRLDKTVAQDIDVIKKLALIILSKDSVYSRITRAKSKKHKMDLDLSDDDDPPRELKRKKTKKSKDIYTKLKRSDDEDSDFHSSDNDGSESNELESDTDDSDSDRYAKRKSHKKKKARSKYLRDETLRYDKGRIRKQTFPGKEKPKDQVDQLSEEIKRLTLKLETYEAPADRGSDREVRTRRKDNDRVEKLADDVRKLMRRIDKDQGSSRPRNDERPRRDGQQRLFNPNAPGNSSPQQPRYCWFCKQTNTHIPGIRNCPSCAQMIKEGLLVDNGYRITLPDGGRIPSVPTNLLENTEQYLRRIYAPKQETPTTTTHQGRASTTTVIEPDPTTYGSTWSTNYGNWMVNEADRTEKRNVRYDPAKKPDSRAPTRGIPYIDVPPLPRPNVPRLQVPAPKPPPKPVSRRPLDENDSLVPPVQFPKPPVILRRPQPDRTPLTEQRMNNIPDQDIEMVDDVPEKSKDQGRTYIPRNPPKMQFTTNLRRKVDITKIMNQIYDQEVKLPLGAILGMSGEVSREVNNDTKTHKDYVSKSSEMPRQAQAAQGGEMTEDEEYESDNDRDSPQQWIDRNYGQMGGIANVGELKLTLDKQLYAMGTGRINLRIGNMHDITAMVDSGSELNLVTRGVVEALNLPWDPAGRAWGIRGINGNSETLVGCCRKVSIEKGGLNFDSVLFVKEGELSNEYSIILGQPWLKETRAMLKYGPENNRDQVILQIHETGGKREGSIMVRLDIDHRREAEKLINSASLIEEPVDEDTYQIQTLQRAYELLQDEQEVHKIDRYLKYEPYDDQIPDNFKYMPTYQGNTKDNPVEHDEAVYNETQATTEDELMEYEQLPLTAKRYVSKQHKMGYRKPRAWKRYLQSEQEDSIGYRVHHRRRRRREKQRNRNVLEATQVDDNIELPEYELDQEVPMVSSDEEPYDPGPEEVDGRFFFGDYERIGIRPSVNAENQDEPSIPSLGRKLAETL